ncbi:two-component regulator propeller domain-containing protein [Parabacteroides goldsteinii]|uniref:hybrid sensor histidine kinase/response regulator transcription factor n=1 Tax=Parabacteroides goldsteinii TaxID=328812 RepID=UPI002AAA8301|nr:two-component regulator propeller domain-containing protein [Parabacteroides goldsteinii]
MFRFRKNHTLYKLILFICLSFSLPALAGNIKNYKFHTLSPEGGFYYDGVKSIQQDSDGFIWIVMENDLFRFDGYQFKRYYSYFRMLDTSDKWYFRDVELDARGHLFVSTNKGLFVYDKITDSFKRMFKPNTMNIKTDSRGNLWLISASLGIFDVEKKTFFGMESEKGLLYNAVILCADEDELITGTSNGEIYRFDYDKMLFEQICALPDNQAIIEIKKHGIELWVLTESYGLYKLDYQTLSIINHYSFFCTLNNEYVPSKTLYVDKNGYVWVGTQRGLYIMNPETEEYSHFTNSKSDIFTLPSNSVWTIEEDAQKNVWIGTYSGGLCYLNFQETSRFRTFSPRENGLNHKVVSGFAEDDESLWIATEGGGVNRMNKKTGEFRYYTHNPSRNSLTYDNVKSLVIDSSQNLWVAMYRGGLDCFSHKTSTFKRFNKDYRSDNGMLTNDLRKIILEADSGLWISYQSTGISFYSFATDRFTHYMSKRDNNNSSISDLCRGKGDDLWVVNNEELYYMNVRTKEYRKIAPDSAYSLRAQALCLDETGNVWIGTVGSGLVRYDVKNNRFYSVNDILRYDVSTIYSLCTDDDNDLWMGTDNGLFKYNIEKNTFFRFDKKDGIQGIVFYPKACMKGKNGELYFGGTNGFTIINPKEVLLSEFKPTAIITDFYIDNAIVKPDSTGSPLHQSISTTREIVLDYNQINFGFKLSSDNYLIPEKNRFKYRLVGYDQRWIEIDATSRIVSYAKVPSGSYTFEVMASNNDGVWNDVPTTIRIRRLPAPWFSWWAYTIYGFLFFTLGGTVLYYYNHQKKLKLELYMDSLEMKKKEENHQAQLRFFTNISHDFRTPLSLIMASVEHMQQQYGNNHYIRLLNSNTRRLLNLVNELMDFRTVENGKMKLKVHLSNINRFVQEVASDFQEYALQKEIDYTIQCDPALSASVYFDEQIMEKVIMNLLNNAFKYTGNGGHIVVETRLDKEPFRSGFKNSYKIQSNPELVRTFSILVKDTGVGISAESIAHEFERFYKVDSDDTEAHIGSGIGLALVKSLVLFHKGAISIYSERNKGTEMLVQFPLDKEMYDAAELLENEASAKNMTLSYFIEPESDKQESFLLRDRKRILLVEDNEDLRGLMAGHLRASFEIVEAGNGAEASGIVEEMEIDLIISDIMMPVKNGITLCREIKENMNYSHIPFIMLTARGGLENQMEGLDSGADAYFEKPVDFGLLKLTVQNIFRQQQNLKEHYARNYFVDSRELAANQQDNKFISRLIEIIESRIDQPDMDVSYIASELSMSRSKLYAKVKSLTDKSIVEFIRSYRLRKAATLLIEENLSIRETMERIGIESQSYFTRVFKNEFGMIPTAFIQKNKAGK